MTKKSSQDEYLKMREKIFAGLAYARKIAREKAKKAGLPLIAGDADKYKNKK